MSRESRTHNKKYYYKKRRIDGKRIREYFGRGRIGQLFAAADQLNALARAADRAQLNTVDREFTQLEHILDRQQHLLQLLTHAHLIAAGYYTHKGQWRKRRDTTS